MINVGIALVSALVLSVIGPRTLSAQTAAPRQWVLSLQTVFGGNATSPDMLTTVGSVLVFPSGTIWVGQARDHGIAVFDAAGKRQRTIGRQGRGPGEFTRVNHIGFLADTVVALDDSRRYHAYAMDGRLLATTAVPTIPQPAPSLSAAPAALLMKGMMVATGRSNLVPRADSTHLWYPVLVARRDGSLARQVATLAPTHASFKIHEASRSVAIPVIGELYDDYALVRPFPAGTGVLLVDRQAATSSGRATYGVRVVDSNGATQWTMKVPYSPIAVPKREVDELIEGLAAGFEDKLGRGAERAVRAAMGPIAPFYPPVMAATAGNDGSVWIAERTVDGKPILWRTWDRWGNEVGQVRVPAGLRVVAAEIGALWAVSLDDDDVQTIHRYTLRLR